MSDATCMIGRTAEDMGAAAPVRAVPPAEWFDVPTAEELAVLSVERQMLDVCVCGDEIGKIVGVVAVEGVPFRTSYGDLVSPMLSDVDVSEINDRAENLMRVDRGGKIEEVPAGKFRFGHSPESFDELDMLRVFHAQNEGTLARFRLFPVTIGGKRALVLKGSVLASVLEPGASSPRPVTFADLDQLQHAETSPEWYENERGKFVYIAHSLVGEGNTNLFDEDERAAFRATVRKAKEETMPENELIDHDGCATCDERAAAADAERVEAEAAERQAMLDRIAALEAANEQVVGHLMNATA